jgi:ABC-type antimicrobial peptide transport system permease subunit
MASSLLILLFAYEELTVDKFHENADRIYRVYSVLVESENELSTALTPIPLANDLANEPEITDAACMALGDRISIRYRNQWTTAEPMFYTSPSFFNIFSFTFIQGNRSKALMDPNSMVLTDKLAKKIFKQENPIGKTLHIRSIGDLTVTGIIKEQRNTHIRLGVILPFNLYQEDPRYEPWQRYNYFTYIRLQKNAEPETLSRKLVEYQKKIYGLGARGQYLLQPVTDIWLHSNLAYDFLTAPYGINVIYNVMALAAIILITACMNYMNLATAQSEGRVEEVGLRKVMGAGRMQIVLQFLGEAILLCCMALIVSIILTEIFLPGFNDLVEIKEINLFESKNISIITVFLLVAAFTGIISGSYPAFFVSAFQPATIIRRQMIAGKKGIVLRKFLLIIQFSISIILVISTLTFNAQLKYMLTKDLGYNSENLLYVPMSVGVRQVYDSIKENLLQHKGISYVTASLNLPTWRGPSSQLGQWDGNTAGKTIRMYHGSVDHDFIDAFQMQIIRGTDFSKKSAPDAPSGLIVNEEAVRQMELEEPIGKRLTMWNHDGPIIGVVKNFHFNNVKNKVEPLVLKVAPEEARVCIIRILPENVPDVLSFIEDNFRRVDVDFAIKPEFLSDSLNRMYTLEQKMSQLFGYSTFLAILISCLGLFGLSAYTIEKRTKELAIRKACGASITKIVKMLSVEFLKLVFIANLIAWPIAYFSVNNWLQDYAYHITLKTTPFLIATALAFIVTLLTVGYQAMKAARANPVDALRYE